MSNTERHRHRCEFNNDFREKLTAYGLTMNGISPGGKPVETVEQSDRSFFAGVQYCPEFKSRPSKPHLLFKGFTEAAVKLRGALK